MFKVVLLGEGANSFIFSDILGRVGKTSMLKSLMKKKFTDSEISTTQASHCQKTFYIENQVLKFQTCLIVEYYAGYLGYSRPGTIPRTWPGLLSGCR